MPITRLNHAVLYVRDVQASAAFYADVLGFRNLDMLPDGFEGAAFLQAEGSTNDHDLGLFQIGSDAGASMAGRSTVGLYHLAWEVDTLAELARIRVALAMAGALTGTSDHSTSKSLYGTDPDGIEFEVAWFVPAEHLDDDVLKGRKGISSLDLDAELERYGAGTVGGGPSGGALAVPALDGGRGLVPAQHAERRRTEYEVFPRRDLQSQPPRGQGSKGVAMAEYQRWPIQITNFPDHRIQARGDVVVGLSIGHRVRPQRPPGHTLSDLRAG